MKITEIKRIKIIYFLISMIKKTLDAKDNGLYSTNVDEKIAWQTEGELKNILKILEEEEEEEEVKNTAYQPKNPNESQMERDDSNFKKGYERGLEEGFKEGERMCVAQAMMIDKKFKLGVMERLKDLENLLQN